MFFTAIHQMMTENVDLTIVIRKANGQLTVATLPKSNGLKDEAQNHIVPLTVTGTPQELDAGFLQTVTRPIQKAGGLIANMAQFEAQADKAAANSKAAREAKSKESKEEREKREKYEKLMKKAEEMTTAKNYREALNLLGQAKAHANEAQLKGIEEKIQAVDKEMNKGSLFDLMERQPQPEQQPVVQNRTQPQPQQVMHHKRLMPLLGKLQQAGNRKGRLLCNSRKDRNSDSLLYCRHNNSQGCGCHSNRNSSRYASHCNRILTMLHKTPDPDRICMECLRQREDGRMNPSCRRMNSSSFTSPILNNRPTIRKTTRIT